MSLFLIGLRGIARERGVLVFTALGLAAVLAPLLVLAGLRTGIVEGLLGELRADVGNREILFRGNYALTPEAVAGLRNLPGAGFVAAAPRSIAARLAFERQEGGPLVQAGVQPTAAGDPILPAGADALDPDGVILSAALARRLGVAAGARVVGRNHRHGTDAAEFVLPLAVRLVLAPHRVQGERAFLTEANLADLESFLDGYAVPARDLPGRPAAERVGRVESVRVYAARLEDVAGLDARLTALGYTVVSRGGQVEGILALDRNLALVTLIVAAVSLGGYAVSLWSGMALQLRHKRRHLSLLRLLGASAPQLVLFPMAQGLAIGVLGCAAALGLALAIAALLNALFADALPGGAPVCRLSVPATAAAVALTLAAILALMAAMGWRLTTLSPAEALRHD